jgi:hypothetical protein
VSGYTFLLFNTVTEIVKFKKLLEKNNQELRSDLMEAKLKQKDQDLKADSPKSGFAGKVSKLQMLEDEEIKSLMDIDEMDLNIDYE